MQLGILTSCSSRRREGDEGIVIVLALVVTAIAFVVMAGILAQAIHNIVLSGYARKRLMAVNAAEAGLNWYTNLANTTNLAALGTSSLGWTVPSDGTNGPDCRTAATVQGSCWYIFSPSNATAYSRTVVATVPELATFEIRVLYTSQNPCLVPGTGTSKQCGLTGTSGVLRLDDTESTPFPDTTYAILRSTGTVGSVQRTLESYVRLRAERNNLQGGIAAISLCLGKAAKVAIVGSLSVNNEAVNGSRPTEFNAFCPETYKNGDLHVGSGDSLTVSASSGGVGGDLTVRGGGLTVEDTQPLSVAGDVWTEGAVQVGSGDSLLPGCDGATQCISGNAIGSNVTIGAKAYLAGEQIVCNPACPPSAAFPALVWNETDWKSPWSVYKPFVTDASGDKLLQLIDKTTTPTVYYINSTNPATCDVSFSTSDNNNFKVLHVNTNVAVVSTCRFTFKGNTTVLQGSGALLLISAAPATEYDAVSYCAGGADKNGIGPHDILMQNNPTIGTGLLVYTACILWIGNNQAKPGEIDSSSLTAQFVARYIIINNAVNMIERPIADYLSSIPGQITGFRLDPKFVREIPSSIALGNLPL